MLSYTRLLGSALTAARVGFFLEQHRESLLRTPLWPVATADSKRFGAFGVTEVPMLDLHELAAGKLAARRAAPVVTDRTP